MKTKNKERKSYNAPVFEHIRLDNEISLILQSESGEPMGDPWTGIDHNSIDNPLKLA